jgi:hypothetical protein
MAAKTLEHRTLLSCSRRATRVTPGTETGAAMARPPAALSFNYHPETGTNTAK